MEIFSSQQHTAFRAGQIPQIEEITSGIWAVPMALPGQFPGGAQSFSYAYTVEDSTGALHVIDPGWNLEDNIERWKQFFTHINKSFEHVAAVIATHLHPDHLGLADEVTSRSGAPLIMHAREARVMQQAADAVRGGDVVKANRVCRVYAAMSKARMAEFGVPQDRWEEMLWVPTEPEATIADQTISDGEDLDVPGRRMTALLTAGHTGGHLSLVEKDANVIFTADHVLPGINSGLGLGGQSPTTPIADYFQGLERVKEFDDYLVAPGHEYAFRGLAQRAQYLREHHAKRTREVACAMEHSTSVWEIAQQVTWSDGFANLRSYKLSSALSQVAMHMEYVRNHSV